METYRIRDEANFIADRDLATAIVECERFVAGWAPRSSLLDLAKLLKNRRTFIFHEINDESAAYTVFEVLNSRGLEVAWLERTKSTLMAIAFEYAPNAKTREEAIHELHHLWGDIMRRSASDRDSAPGHFVLRRR
jgi:hypothetical protein